MGSRFRKPEEIRLELSGGDWLLVRKHLTAGEEREAYVRLIKDGGNPGDIDIRKMGIAEVSAYLIDWNLTDADDKPIRVRDADFAFVFAALSAMDPESLVEIVAAISDHDKAMKAAREAQKKILTGDPVPSPTSISVA